MLLVAASGEAAFEQRATGARTTALGGAAAASADDVSSLFDNPAGLSFIKSFSASGGGYELFPSLDLAEPVTTFHFSAGLPVNPSLVLGAAGRTFGLGLYRETEGLLACSAQFRRKWAAALSLKYLRAAGRDLTAANAFGMDAAALVKLNDQIRFGTVFRNLNAPVLADSADHAARSAELGAGWSPAAGLFFTASFCLDTDAPDGRVSLKAGSEWRFADWLSLRAGFDTGRPAVTAGLGVRYRWVAFDYAWVQSPVTAGQSVFSASFDLSESRRSVFREVRPKSARKMTLEDLGPEKEYSGERVDINTATVEELEGLPKIGPAMARSIVEYREKHGPFKRKEDIMNVPRIGVKTYAKFREFITVGSGTSDVSPDTGAGGGETPVDINTITLKDLVELKVAPLTAVRIVKYRDEHAPLKSFEDLRKAPDITPEELDAARPLIEHLFK
jgi:competence protein ComEA